MAGALHGGGWRMPSPAAEALVRWPDDFGSNYLITVDVEEEFDWSRPLSRTATAVTATSAMPAAHRRFADHGTGLVCLVDYPVATDPAALEHLRPIAQDGSSEIGTQLHPWVNPPHDEPLTPVNSFPGNLPAALERIKLETLTGAIADGFGRSPRIYRAGRYGLGPDTGELLGALGYRVDTSPRARYDYRGQGGPDFRGIAPDAFHRDGLLTLPLTTVFTGRARRLATPLHAAAGRVPKGRGLLARTGLLQRVALTPEGMPVEHVLEAIRIALDDGLRLFTLSFHSPSLVAGHTPYVRDAADLQRFWAWWDAVLALLDRRGVRPVTLGEVIAAVG